MTAQHPQGSAADTATGAAVAEDIAAEAPEADIAEQRAELTADSDADGREPNEPFDVPDDVPEADAVEQNQVVGGDPDEYR